MDDSFFFSLTISEVLDLIFYEREELFLKPHKRASSAFLFPSLLADRSTRYPSSGTFLPGAPQEKCQWSSSPLDSSLYEAFFGFSFLADGSLFQFSPVSR